MTQEEKRFYCAELCRNYFDSKQHIIEYKEFAGNKFEFRTYEVQVAVFGDDFTQPPVTQTIRVRLSDDEYLLLLQWQLQSPNLGFNACYVELSDISTTIECQVEDKIFGDNDIGTYAIYLSEIRQDVAVILSTLV